jgi:hypothetical protein
VRGRPELIIISPVSSRCCLHTSIFSPMLEHSLLFDLGFRFWWQHMRNPPDTSQRCEPATHLPRGPQHTSSCCAAVPWEVPAPLLLEDAYPSQGCARGRAPRETTMVQMAQSVG